MLIIFILSTITGFLALACMELARGAIKAYSVILIIIGLILIALPFMEGV